MRRLLPLLIERHLQRWRLGLHRVEEARAQRCCSPREEIMPPLLPLLMERQQQTLIPHLPPVDKAMLRPWDHRPMTGSSLPFASKGKCAGMCPPLPTLLQATLPMLLQARLLMLLQACWPM